MSAMHPEPEDLVLGLAGPHIAEAVTRRLAHTAASDARTPCSRCGSPDCATNSGRPSPYGDFRPAAEIVADVLGALSKGPTPARPRVLRGVLPADPGKRPVSLTPTELALRPDLTPDELSRLLHLDNPEVDARLFGHPALNDRERRRMLDGVGSDGSVGTVGAPLLDLLWTVDSVRLRRRLPLAIGSGDPGVASVIAGRVELRTESGRLRPIVAVWTRHGVEAARRLLESASYPAPHAEQIRQALAAPDGLDITGTNAAGPEGRVCGRGHACRTPSKASPRGPARLTRHMGTVANARSLSPCRQL
ncbi:hypothetical protein [Embleya sp. NBC_00896]|uniref:hypothetical protein n=1 Tax=Embleya sp. NBC_00896 TaxID=2975961 RepID=UPI002F908D82|nr:hypothetical protein OG928_33450 [Embleya sp. NBC_00896]